MKEFAEQSGPSHLKRNSLAQFARSELPNLARVNVVGTSGTGKTTFARRLAGLLDVPVIEMDRLFWAADWQQVETSEFRDRLANSLQRERWVLDGNYVSKTEDIKWALTTAVIWLDYSFPRTVRQAISRAFRRAWTRKEIWPGTGNRETFRRSLLSHDSIVLWTITCFFPVRRRYEQKMLDTKYGHIQFVRLTHPRQAQIFLDEVVRSQPFDQEEPLRNSTKSDHGGEGSDV